jgi:hypothetical protein
MAGQAKTTARAETVAFRCSRYTKRLIAAASVKLDIFPSDWLREAAEEKLERELGLSFRGNQPESPAVGSGSRGA